MNTLSITNLAEQYVKHSNGDHTSIGLILENQTLLSTESQEQSINNFNNFYLECSRITADIIIQNGLDSSRINTPLYNFSSIIGLKSVFEHSLNIEITAPYQSKFFETLSEHSNFHSDINSSSVNSVVNEKIARIMLSNPNEYSMDRDDLITMFADSPKPFINKKVKNHM